MSDSKVQVKNNHKVWFMKYCNKRIRFYEESIKWSQERSWDNQHLKFLKSRLKEELEYKKKLSQQITATTC